MADEGAFETRRPTKQALHRLAEFCAAEGCDFGRIVARLLPDQAQRRVLDAVESLKSRPSESFFDSLPSRHITPQRLSFRGSSERIGTRNRSPGKGTGMGPGAPLSSTPAPRSSGLELDSTSADFSVTSSMNSGNFCESDVCFCSSVCDCWATLSTGTDSVGADGCKNTALYDTAIRYKGAASI